MDSVKMVLKLVYLLTVLMIPTQQMIMADGFECILTEPPQMRSFDSFSEYRSNKRPFTPTQLGFQGNHVSFRFDSIDQLMTSMFRTYDSQHIIKLNLSGKGIQRIDNIAFSGLSCLHILDLSHNNITDISKEIFNGLQRLRQLNLSNNQISDVPEEAFAYLESLEYLSLANNHIKSISNSLVFFNLSYLEILNLNGNEFHDSPEGLQYLKRLKTLRMENNNIRKLDLWKIVNVSSTLEVLDMNNNSIQSINFTISGTRVFSALKELNLSNNSIRNIDVHGLKSKCPSLIEISLIGNAWECQILSVVLHELDDAGVAYDDTNVTSTMNKNKDVTTGSLEGGIPCTSRATLYRQPPPAAATTDSPSGDRVHDAAAAVEREAVQRNWTEMRQTLRELLFADRLNVQLTRDALRDLASLQNVLVLLTVGALLWGVGRACLRGGLCRRCAHYARDGRLYQPAQPYINHDRDRGARQRGRVADGCVNRDREREALLGRECATYERL